MSALSETRNDARLLSRELYYEQLSFWRNPFGAIFTVGFSLVFLVLLGADSGTSPSATLGGLRLIQYYVPGFAAYGVMSACFNMLGTTLVARRESGLLKRRRLSPLPSWGILGGVVANSAVVSFLQVVVLLLVGRYAYDVSLPVSWAPLVLALFVGVVCFTTLGIAASTIVPNQEAAGPMLSIVFFVLLFLSGLWFPLKPGSGLADVSGYFPVRHLIVAAFAPFDKTPGASPWAWHDLAVVAIWGVAGGIVALRRFRYEPRRA